MRPQHPSADSQNLPFFSGALTIPLKRPQLGNIKRPATKNHTNPAYAPRHYSDVDTEERVMALQAAFGDALGAGLSEPQATGPPKNQGENSQLLAPKSHSISPVQGPESQAHAPKPGTQVGSVAEGRGGLRPAPLTTRKRPRTCAAFPHPARKMKKPRNVRGLLKLWHARSEGFRILLAWVKDPP